MHIQGLQKGVENAPHKQCIGIEISFIFVPFFHEPVEGHDELGWKEAQ